MSIRPEPARRLLGGSKRFELRRRAPRFEPGTTVLVYVSRPVGAVVGAFTAGEVLRDEPISTQHECTRLLAKMASTAMIHAADLGVDHGALHGYFKDADVASAIEVVRPRLVEPFTLRAGPPQSWRYVRDVLGMDATCDWVWDDLGCLATMRSYERGA